MNKLIKILITMTSLSTINAYGALITYTDRSAFESALSSFVLEDFESTALGAQGTSTNFGDATISNIGGVFVTDGFGAPTVQVGDQNNQDTLISLLPNYNALGMDIGLLFGAGSIDMILKDTLGNTLLSQNLSVTDNNNLGTVATTFYGFISDSSNIGSIELLKSGFPTIDNLTYGVTGVAVPSPETLPLILLGLFLMRYHRNTAKNLCNHNLYSA